jgi:photosystem II stability/assembly factor-like uncharacterized protein
MGRKRQARALAVLAVGGLLCGCAASSGTPGADSAQSHSRVAAAVGCPANGGSSGTAAGGSSGGSSAAALQAVQFTDPEHGWLAGAGRILATTDGGRSWTRQYSGPAQLDQVDFTDAAHGWAVGPGALLRTADGGSSWTSLPEPRVAGQCLAVGSVHFVSPTDGYAVAGPPPASSASTSSASVFEGSAGVPAAGGRLLRTADGGRTWSGIAAAPSGAQSACFGSARDGYAGASGRIWRTTDAGLTWALVFTEPRAAAGQAAASQHRSASGSDTPLLQCAGPAAAWVLFLGSGAAMMHVPYLAYATAQGSEWHGVMEEPVLESALRPALHLAAGPGSEPGPFSVISPQAAVFIGYTPPANGWGAAPVALVTGGGTALRQAGNVAGINRPLAAAFLSQSQGWVVGENLRTNRFLVEATGDGGRSWTTQYTTS